MDKEEEGVTSYEVSKELDERGYNKDTVWSWYEHSESDSFHLDQTDNQHVDTGGYSEWKVKAYTPTELLNILPHGVAIYKSRLVSRKETTYHFQALYDDISVSNTNLANALAMLILQLDSNSFFKQELDKS